MLGERERGGGSCDFVYLLLMQISFVVAFALSSYLAILVLVLFFYLL